MRRAEVLLSGGFVATIALVLVAASTAPTKVVGGLRPWGGPVPAPPPPPAVSMTASATVSGAPATSTPSASSAAFAQALAIGMRVLVLVAVVTLVVVGVRWWRQQRMVTIRSLDKAAPPPAHVIAAEVREAVDAEAEAQLELVAEGPPREGILACWHAIEAAVAEASGSSPTHHWRTLTPTELAAAARESYDLPAAPLSALASLYREARFSTHELGDTHRARAIASLQELRDGLSLTPTEAS